VTICLSRAHAPLVYDDGRHECPACLALADRDEARERIAALDAALDAARDELAALHDELAAGQRDLADVAAAVRRGLGTAP
jgi:septal ring factor EnvC (AmiA/AmiB activator)